MKKSKIFCPMTKEKLYQIVRDNTEDLRDFECTTYEWKQQNVWGDACRYQGSIRYSPHLWELRRY